MFNQIRYRLLLSYLLVFASLLVTFAVAVRLFVIQSFNEILTAKLMDLGEEAAANTKFDQGKIIVDDAAIARDVLVRERILEWFDVQGNRIAKQGKYKMKSIANDEPSLQIKIKSKKNINHANHQVINKLQALEPDLSNPSRIKSVILPLYSIDKHQPIGYLRVSQPLKELDDNIHDLDWGLGLGILLGLGLSGVSGIWLTRQAMKPIEDNFQRLKQFTADASHELRSPLMAIKTNANVALKYATGMRADDQGKFQVIANAAEQISQLTEDLLFLARHENLPELKKEKINLTAVLEELVQLYFPVFESKGIHCQVEIEMFLGMWGDQGQIHRLFNNLIANALNYTARNGSIYLKAFTTGSHLSILVQDTGIGISPENLPHIFDRFWRADQARSYHQGGSGLGLAIAQAIVHNHQGSISVTSEVEKGSCFTVILPKDLKG